MKSAMPSCESISIALGTTAKQRLRFTGGRTRRKKASEAERQFHLLAGQALLALSGPVSHEEIQHWLYHLIAERKQAPSTIQPGHQRGALLLRQTAPAGHRASVASHHAPKP